MLKETRETLLLPKAHMDSKGMTIMDTPIVNLNTENAYEERPHKGDIEDILWYR